MPRSPNATLAIQLFDDLRKKHNPDAASAWKGIALSLLTCDQWAAGWRPFHDCVIYRETNDFKTGPSGRNAVLRRANDLSDFLALELGVTRAQLCATIGQYWRLPVVSGLQPHNLVGHAFRSLIVHVLESFGNGNITYEEEVDPRREFPGFAFTTRSKNPKIDIVARKGNVTVALMSARWRFRHDRVDVVEEALAYATAARRHNQNCKLFAVVGEFAPNRLDKILTNCPPVHVSPPLDAAIHFGPQLILQGLKENGRLKHLRGLDWLLAQTQTW
jgi:hypothetical protein